MVMRLSIDSSGLDILNCWGRSTIPSTHKSVLNVKINLEIQNDFYTTLFRSMDLVVMSHALFL